MKSSAFQHVNVDGGFIGRVCGENNQLSRRGGGGEKLRVAFRLLPAKITSVGVGWCAHWLLAAFLLAFPLYLLSNSSKSYQEAIVIASKI